MLKSVLKMASVCLLTWKPSLLYQISSFMTIKPFGYQKFCKLNGKTSKLQAWVPLLTAWCKLSLKVQGKMKYICNYSEFSTWLQWVFLAARHPRVSLDSKSEFAIYTVMQLQHTELNSCFISLIFTEAFASGTWELGVLQPAGSCQELCSRGQCWGYVQQGFRRECARGWHCVDTRTEKYYTSNFLRLGSSGMQESFIKNVKSSLVLLWLGSGLYL